MKKALIATALLFTTLTITGIVLGDNDERNEGRGWYARNALDVAPVENERYKSECGTCHFAYQPGLLPANSWKRLMGGLAEHFGDNAELEPAVQQELLNYLVVNAADASSYKRSEKIAASVGKNEAPLRITDTLYFKRKHDEVPARLVTGNPKVGSFSNCSACHTKAASGSFNEHQVRIPGVGRWDD